MDIETGLGTSIVCVICVGIAGAVVFLTSVLGGVFKETSYEEAVLSKRNSIDVTVPAKTSKKDKKEKDKKDKKDKKHQEKKVAAKKTQQHQPPKDSDKEQDRLFGEQSVPTTSSEENVLEIAEPQAAAAAPNGESVQATTAADAAAIRSAPTQGAKQHHHKQEHVEFEDVNQIIILNEEETEHLSQRRVSSSEDRPRRTILKADMSPGYESKPAATSKARRGNSFDTMHPKDDFELEKHREEKARRSLASSREELDSADKAPSVPAEELLNGHGKLDSADDNLVDSTVTIAEQPAGVESRDRRKSKKVKTPAPTSTATIQAFPRAAEITPRRLLEVVKTLPLSNEEIQSVINELLNRQGDETSVEWKQKNDPMGNLKKSLQEKECALQLETTNLEAAKARLREIRVELDQEKMKQHAFQNKLALHQQELQTYNARQQQTYDAHRKELSTLQNKMQAERVLAVQRAQEENARLVQAIQQIEKERPTSEVLSQLQHEIEQLRVERQQMASRQAALQKANDELSRQVGNLEDRLNAFHGDKQKTELSFQQHVGEVQSQLRETEAARSALENEIGKVHSQCNNLESENITLRKKADQLLGEKDDVESQLESKINELNKTKNALEEAQKEAREAIENAKANESNGIANGDQCEKLQTELVQSSSEKEKLNSELGDLHRQNEELRQKNFEASETLINTEKLAQERLDSAVRESEQKAESKLESLTNSRSDAESRLSAVEGERDRLNEEKSRLLEAIKRLVPEASLNSSDSICDALGQLASERASEDSNSKQESADLKDQLNTKSAEVNRLQDEVEKYKSALSNTDDVLKKLESNAVEEQQSVRSLEEECCRIGAERDTLLTQKKELESTIKELQGLGQTVVEMEEKLKDLQSKLQGGEQERKALSSKFEEVSIEATSKASTVQEELEKKTKEIETIAEERAEVERIKAENEQLRAESDKDRKSMKELQTQNVKLKSLVKIGEDSIKAEQSRSNDLQEQLKLRNGNVVSASTPCLTTTNGSPQTLLNNSSNSLNIVDESRQNYGAVPTSSATPASNSGRKSNQTNKNPVPRSNLRGASNK